MAAFFAKPPMLTQEQAVEIRVLARRGVGIREIARQLGCSRNTVRRYLKDETASRYKPRPVRESKLEPFKPYVLERVEAARPHWIPSAVLLRELQERGYSGGSHPAQGVACADEARTARAGRALRDGAR